MLQNLKIYTADHVHARIICSAFSQGTGAKQIPCDPPILQPGPALVYGILRGCGEIIKQCQMRGREFFYVDHGYMNRGYYDGYFKITCNARQPTDRSLGSNSLQPSDRFQDLEIEIRDWRKIGSEIIIVPPSETVAQFLGFESQVWTQNAIEELKLHSDRPIRVNTKKDIPVEGLFPKAWCLVTHSSNAAVDALIRGIPVITLGESACQSVSWSFEDIESPWWPEREPWLHWLAYQQYSLDEVRRGIDFSQLSGSKRRIARESRKLRSGRTPVPAESAVADARAPADPVSP